MALGALEALEGCICPLQGPEPFTTLFACYDTTVLGLGAKSTRLHVQFGWLQGRLPRLGTNLFVGSLSQVQPPRMKSNMAAGFQLGLLEAVAPPWLGLRLQPLFQPPWAEARSLAAFWGR